MSDDQRSARNLPHHNSETFARGARVPAQADLEAAAELLNSGKKVAILAGQGALNAGAELERVAETLAAPIVKALLGKSCVPDNSPYTTGGIGLLGTSTMPYIEFYPKPGAARSVQVDLDPARIGLRYPVEIGLVGDSRRTLEALLPLLKRNESRGFLEKAQNGMLEWRELMKTRGTNPATPMQPEVPAWELGQRLPSNALIAADSGTNTTWWARCIPSLEGQMHTCSGNLATMACGFPYAIAAQVAYPDRPVVAFVGDGGFSMLMAELATCVKYKLPVKVVIVKNNSLGQIKWEQMVFLGNPEYACDLEPIDFAMFARACGATGFTIDGQAACGQILERALATPGPVVIEVLVDPNAPPLPAKIKPEQALRFAESLARGTADRGKILQSVMREKIREIV